MLTCVSSVSSSVAPHQWTVSDCLWLVSLVISVCNRVLCELTAISLRLSETTVCRSVNRWKQLQWAFHMILQLKLSQSTSIYFWSMMLTAVGGVSVILISVCVCFSSALSVYLSSSHDGSRLCEFSITQYACADVCETHCSQTCEHALRLCKHVFSVCVRVCVCVQLTDLSSQHLAKVLSCGLSRNENMSEETWKLFTQKVNPVLGPALDLLADMVHDSTLASGCIYINPTYKKINQSQTLQ